MDFFFFVGLFLILPFLLVDVKTYCSTAVQRSKSLCVPPIMFESFTRSVQNKNQSEWEYMYMCFSSALLRMFFFSLLLLLLFLCLSV